MGPASRDEPSVSLDHIYFFVYSRATPSTRDDENDAALNEEHWSYMDTFAYGMIARGPTLATDRATWTGSIHIVDLPSIEAAREFAEREPYNRAGLFEHHMIRRFKNLLGRTMWEFPAGSLDPHFFVIAHLSAQAGEHAPATVPAAFTALPRERMIVHGELLTLQDAAPAGAVFALQAPTRAAVEPLFKGGQAGRDGHDIEILDWEFGGRR